MPIIKLFINPKHPEIYVKMGIKTWEKEIMVTRFYYQEKLFGNRASDTQSNIAQNNSIFFPTVFASWKKIQWYDPLSFKTPKVNLQ